MKYIDADKLLAEIQWRKQQDITIRERSVLIDIEIAITSLQQEHLEKAFIQEYATYHLPTFVLASLVDGTELIDFIYDTARHFYELGLNATKEK